MESLHYLFPDIIMKQWGIESSISNPFQYNTLLLTIYLEILLDSQRLSICLITYHFFSHNTHGGKEMDGPRHLVKIPCILSSLMNPGEIEVIFHILEIMTFYWLILASYWSRKTWLIKNMLHTKWGINFRYNIFQIIQI